MYRLDQAFEKIGAMLEDPLDFTPGDYVRRDVWATFQGDRSARWLVQFFGEDNFMWRKTFHTPLRRAPIHGGVIARDFNQVPEAVKRKIVCENTAHSYQIDLN